MNWDGALMSQGYVPEDCATGMPQWFASYAATPFAQRRANEPNSTEPNSVPLGYTIVDFCLSTPFSDIARTCGLEQELQICGWSYPYLPDANGTLVPTTDASVIADVCRRTCGELAGAFSVPECIFPPSSPARGLPPQAPTTRRRGSTSSRSGRTRLLPICSGRLSPT